MPNYFQALVRGLDGSSQIESGSLGNRPPPRVPDSVYKATDQAPPEYYVCDGDEWIEITLLVSSIDVGAITVDGVEDTLDGTFPGWGTANSVEVTAGLGRQATASFEIAADTDSAAKIQCEVEDDSGTMQTVAEEGVPAGVITTALTVSTTFYVPTGRSYQFVRSGNAGVVETNVHYSHTDLGV